MEQWTVCVNERFLLVHTQTFYCCYSKQRVHHCLHQCTSSQTNLFVSFIKMKFIWGLLNDTALRKTTLVSSLSLLPGVFSLFTGVLCVCVDWFFLWIGTKEWYKGKSFYCGMERLEKFPLFLLIPVPVVFCLQAGKKPVRAVLWVSADGLRVVDDKTKVISPFSPSSQAWKHLDHKERAARGSTRGFSKGGSCWAPAVNNDSEAAIPLV